jgi:hypothetical protein
MTEINTEPLTKNYIVPNWNNGLGHAHETPQDIVVEAFFEGLRISGAVETAGVKPMGGKGAIVRLAYVSTRNWRLMIKVDRIMIGTYKALKPEEYKNMTPKELRRYCNTIAGKEEGLLSRIFSRKEK